MGKEKFAISEMRLKSELHILLSNLFFISTKTDALFVLIAAQEFLLHILSLVELLQIAMKVIQVNVTIFYLKMARKSFLLLAR